MSFVQKNLSLKETVVYQTKMHWWVFVSGGALLLLGLLFMGQSSDFGGFIIAAALILLVVNYLNWTSSEFVITNKRVILKTGFITRKLVEIQLNKAEGLIVEQGLFGRILNFGGIGVTSAGVKTTFAPMEAPFAFKKQVNEALEAHTV